MIWTTKQSIMTILRYWKRKRIEKKSSWGEGFFNGGTIWLSEHIQACRPRQLRQVLKKKRSRSKLREKGEINFNKRSGTTERYLVKIRGKLQTNTNP